LEAGFSKGYFICDFLDTAIIINQSDTITIDVLYNIIGPLPAAYCLSYDTLEYNIPSGTYVLQIRNNIAFVNANGHIDTALMTTQTFNNLVLSMDDYETVETIKLYPNPTLNEIHIMGLAMSASKKIEFNIYNLQGALMGKRDVGINPEGSATINLDDLPNGIYLIQFYNNEKLHSKKILKN
jgi:hypothetical protein